MIGYFGSALSDNITETPEGFIVCHDVPIARTGFQTYKISELPKKRAIDLGIDVSNPGAEVKLYRSPEEVFNPDTIHSFEGKPITNNHPPGEEFVVPENYAELAMGHIQNVHKGKEPLESGEWPLLADLVITREPLITEVKTGKKREVSCGYEFNIDRDGDVILQIDMLGNHNAVVPKGRAGHEARINDSAPAAEEVASEETAQIEAVTDGAREEIVRPEPQPKPITNAVTRQEKKPMNWTLKGLFGLGLKEAAKRDDAEPEALADAAQQFSRLTKGSVRANDAEMDGEHCDDRRADDRHRSDDRRTDDSHKADDEHADDRHADDRRSDDRRSDDRRADDRHADDRRADDFRGRMHKQLDRMLDARRRSDDSHGGDADMNELRSLMDDYLQEETHEPEHLESEDADPDMVTEEEEEMEREGEADDELGEVAPEVHVVSYSADSRDGDRKSDDKKARDKKKRAADDGRARAADTQRGGMEVIRALKPLVARSKDSALRSAFNAQVRRVKGSSFGSDGSYGEFARSSRDHSRARDAEDAPDKSLAKLNDYYHNAHNKKTAEVK